VARLITFLNVQSKLQWVIEAKPPGIAIGIDDIEQAWTYANHPEVRAVYFSVCNGRTLMVYRSDQAPEAPALLSLSYEELEKEFPRLSDLLGPDALLRDFPVPELGFGPPLAAGLRSIARVTGGNISYAESNLQSPAFHELQLTVTHGALERRENGGVVAFLKTFVPSQSWQEVNERLGLSSFEMSTEDDQLSTDDTRPTVFVHQSEVTLAAGEKLFDIQSWQKITLPMNVVVSIRAEAKGTYLNRLFSGVFATDYSASVLSLRVSGSFKITLA
jgi:hypothetical protein